MLAFGPQDEQGGRSDGEQTKFKVDAPYTAAIRVTVKPLLFFS